MITSGIINELVADLIKVEAEIENPLNTSSNPFFHSKYAPLNEILAMVRPLLAKHNITVTQNVGGSEGKVSVSTILMHKSGQYIESEPLTLELAEKTNPQKAGSAITYLRRYSLTAILGVFSEDDDDGNVAAHGSMKPKAEKPKPTMDKEMLTAPPQEKKPFVRRPA